MSSLRTLLGPLSLIYGAGVRLRAWCFRRGLFQTERLPCPVICVGNLTVGGTGKTPVVLWIASRLRERGYRVGILSRGYRSYVEDPEIENPTGAPLAKTSDEISLLRARLGGEVLFGVGPNRFGAGQKLVHQGAQILLLDDGFQHLQLERDLDVVLLDGAGPFAGGRLLPAGRLREPPTALSRAGVIVITRAERAPAVEAAARRFSHAPIFYAQAELDAVLRFEGTFPGRLDPDARSKRLFAFCGIGNARGFFEDLRRWGFCPAGEAIFRDHHRYSQRDYDGLEREARAAGAGGLVCTEKDIFNLGGVRWSRFPTYYCRISMYVQEEEEFLGTILAVVSRGAAGKPS